MPLCSVSVGFPLPFHQLHEILLPVFPPEALSFIFLNTPVSTINLLFDPKITWEHALPQLLDAPYW